jgi:hypothetical protein
MKYKRSAHSKARFIVGVLQQCKTEGGISRKFARQLCVLRLLAEKNLKPFGQAAWIHAVARALAGFNRVAR